MSEDGDRASAPPRLLRALTEELRDSEGPPIAWDDMEARLLARIDAASEDASVPPASDGRAEILVPWDDDAPEGEESLPLAFKPEASRRSRPEAAPTEHAARAAPPAAPRRIARASWAFGGVFAAAAVAAAWLLGPSAPSTTVVTEPVDLASVAVEPRLGEAFDLAGLRAGDVVEASEGPVTFGRAGILQWTLSAGGRVRVVSGVGHEEPRHVIALEAGALDVDVVPLEDRRPEDGDALMGPGRNPVDGSSADPTYERFVVEVGGARVAVHGTAFRVVRSSRGVVLDVVRGVVAVGPLAGGEGSEQLVRAPARAAFGLDGASFQALPALADGSGVAKSDPRPSAVRRAARGEIVARSNGDERYAGAVEELAPGVPTERPAPEQAPAPAAQPTVATAKEPERVVPPAPAPVDARGDAVWTADRVRSEVSACIARAGERSSDGARVTIASSVVVDVDAAGATRGVRFDPPIRPDLQACGQPVLHARFPAGTGRLSVPLEVRLGPPR